MSIYEGLRDEDGPIVLKDGISLSPKRSLKVCNHSPDGFEWGYGGSGPAQLALALLLEETNDKDLSFRLHHKFKDAFVSKFSRDKFMIPSELIAKFLESNIALAPKT